jgi:hypothetical protein
MSKEDQQLEESINKTNTRTRTQERRPRRKRGDLVKMRIDGISLAVNPDMVVRKFCSAFGEVSALDVRSNSEGDCWALVELREPERFKESWAEWLNPRILDGWRVQVESEDSEYRGPIISMP